MNRPAPGDTVVVAVLVILRLLRCRSWKGQQQCCGWHWVLGLRSGERRLWDLAGRGFGELGRARRDEEAGRECGDGLLDVVGAICRTGGR